MRAQVRKGVGFNTPATDGRSGASGGPSPATGSIPTGSATHASVQSVSRQVEDYNNILDTIGIPNSTTIRNLFSGDGCTPADTVPSIQVSFELFEAVQSRFAATKQTLERTKTELLSRNQQYTQLQSQLSALTEEYGILKRRNIEAEENNTALHQQLARSEVTVEQLRKEVGQVHAEMNAVREGLQRREDELQEAQNRIAEAAVFLAQKDTVIATLRRELGTLGRFRRKGEDNSPYTAETLERIAEDVRGRTQEARIKLSMTDLELKLRRVEQEKACVLDQHTQYLRHVEKVVEAYETQAIALEDGVATHQCVTTPYFLSSTFYKELSDPEGHSEQIDVESVRRTPLTHNDDDAVPTVPTFSALSLESHRALDRLLKINIDPASLMKEELDGCIDAQRSALQVGAELIGFLSTFEKEIMATRVSLPEVREEWCKARVPLFASAVAAGMRTSVTALTTTLVRLLNRENDYVTMQHDAVAAARATMDSGKRRSTSSVTSPTIASVRLTATMCASTMTRSIKTKQKQVQVPSTDVELVWENTTNSGTLLHQPEPSSPTPKQPASTALPSVSHGDANALPTPVEIASSPWEGTHRPSLQQLEGEYPLPGSMSPLEGLTVSAESLCGMALDSTQDVVVVVAAKVGTTAATASLSSSVLSKAVQVDGSHLGLALESKIGQGVHRQRSRSMTPSQHNQTLSSAMRVDPTQLPVLIAGCADEQRTPSTAASTSTSRSVVTEVSGALSSHSPHCSGSSLPYLDLQSSNRASSKYPIRADVQHCALPTERSRVVSVSQSPTPTPRLSQQVVSMSDSTPTVVGFPFEPEPISSAASAVSSAAGHGQPSFSRLRSRSSTFSSQQRMSFVGDRQMEDLVKRTSYYASKLRATEEELDLLRAFRQQMEQQGAHLMRPRSGTVYDGRPMPMHLAAIGSTRSHSAENSPQVLPFQPPDTSSEATQGNHIVSPSLPDTARGKQGPIASSRRAAKPPPTVRPTRSTILAAASRPFGRWPRSVPPDYTAELLHGSDLGAMRTMAGSHSGLPPFRAALPSINGLHRQSLCNNQVPNPPEGIYVTGTSPRPVPMLLPTRLSDPFHSIGWQITDQRGADVERLSLGGSGTPALPQWRSQRPSIVDLGANILRRRSAAGSPVGLFQWPQRRGSMLANGVGGRGMTEYRIQLQSVPTPEQYQRYERQILEEFYRRGSLLRRPSSMQVSGIAGLGLPRYHSREQTLPLSRRPVDSGRRSPHKGHWSAGGNVANANWALGLRGQVRGNPFWLGQPSAAAAYPEHRVRYARGSPLQRRPWSGGRRGWRGPRPLHGDGRHPPMQGMSTNLLSGGGQVQTLIIGSGFRGAPVYRRQYSMVARRDPFERRTKKQMRPYLLPWNRPPMIRGGGLGAEGFTGDPPLIAKGLASPKSQRLG